MFNKLKSEYNSDLWYLYNSSQDSYELDRMLKGLGKGIGDTTVSIFLRDMRNIWPKASSKPTAQVKLAMDNLGIVDLNYFALKRNIDLVRLESALLRFGKDFFKKCKKMIYNCNYYSETKLKSKLKTILEHIDLSAF